MVTLVNLRAYWRFVRVLHQFLPLIVTYARDRRKYLLFGGPRSVGPETQRERADRLLTSLLTLGPTFIKLGQLLSTRPDVLPPSYIDVLSSLQDDVPPAPWDETRPVLEAEVGPVDEVFDDFEREAISGASLGQVYRATYEGEEIAIKVRRPGVEALVESDLRALKWLLPLLLRFTDEARRFSLSNLAEEFDTTIREEMDYNRERRMLSEIRENFEGNDRIRIPDPIPELSGERVLAMEYLAGTKINDVTALDEQGLDRSELAESLQRIYLQMIIEDGVFHADPHPGNLSVDEDGAIIFYDFGMSGRVDAFFQDKIVEFYVAVANQDIDGILDAMVEMGTLSPNADRQVMGNVMELAIADVRGEDIEQYRVQQVIQQVEDTIYEFPLRLPRNFALILRVATVVEGVCITLDPDFDFISVATDYLTEQGYREEGVRQAVESAGDQLEETARSLVTVPPKLDETLDRVNRDDLTVEVRLDDEHDVLDQLAKRIAYSILVAVGILSTAILYSFNETPEAAAVAGAVTIPVGILLYRSLRRKKGVKARPQFTRQEMRRRREE
ncbi:Predicted unusual protein kinase regulating ubiquinone biosynthesis, AarF/ABC1/UbiB family [Haloplanus vescus]|uniref:Predicted unusual protein kinase regulating ubiquinone biosynthesis, AarF/ABC1/UbiB family n=1 Tax=Haloplanus vescus TaxID=555874 RepID=A0A1H3Y392_9EURY|nr:AarF/ABC1/UbiB kinase family protein [Haloplanus vescus]SEA06000.1 Predicted unusual protein kinase regulating ubiquinone biosynthesis, AarF/ABC1/UbiB family [Haloplanus vescus]